MVVVPTDPDPTVNIELFPDRREATVDLPTPLPPTMETMLNWVFNSTLSSRLRSLSLASSINSPGE